MAKIQCKMCGRELTLPEGVLSGNCEHCGSLVTFPRVSIHGVKKVAAKNAPAAAAAASAPQPGTGKINPLLRRAQIFVESGDFNSAREFCENVLNQEPENGWAYFTRMMAELQIADEKNLETVDFTGNRSYKLAQRFADEELKAKFAAIEAKKQQKLAAIKAEKERVERQRQAMFAVKRLDVELRNGINERINLLQRHLRCEKSLQKQQDVIAALEKSLAQEKGLLNRNELLTEDTVQPTREYSMQTMAAAGDLEKKESKCSRKKFIEIALVMGAFFAITLVVLMIGGCVKKNDLASGDVCKIKDGVVVGVRYDEEDITKVVIPNGVTKIGNYAFSGCRSLTSVTIPNSVTEIEDSAFSGCSSLTGVTIPNSVTEIEDSAFSGCTRLKEVIVPEKCKIADNTFPKKCLVIKLPAELVTKIRQGDAYALAKLDELRSTLQRVIEFSADRKKVTGVKYKNITTATIPSSVTEIGVGAFSDCTSLTSVTIPDSVTKIGENAFSNCSSLTSVTIPDSVTYIGWSAFYGCSSLTSVTIPNGVKTIRSRAFSAVKSVKVAAGNRNYYSGSQGELITHSGTLLYVPPAVRTYIVPDSVTKIGNYAFSGCRSLTSVTIPNSVTKIGSWAFEGCSSLTSVTIPNSVTEIGDYAFSRCSSLTSVTIPDRVIEIGEFAFYGCDSLTSVTIPNSVTEIGNCAFKGCTSLTSVTIPASVTEIDGFSGCTSLTSVTILDGVKTIDWGAFSGCSSLTSVTIPNSVTYIGFQAFSDCTSLTSVTIPNSVTEIGSWAFKGCTSLKEVRVPRNCSIGHEAFPAGCNVIRY